MAANTFLDLVKSMKSMTTIFCISYTELYIWTLYTPLSRFSFSSQFQLVRMLSPLEIQKARDLFHAFDKDEDGYINSYEVATGFNRWFGNLRTFDKDR